jgi:L-serine dehydratase
MPVSVFELFKIGIGPSSSHTVGPMVAARRFAMELENQGMLDQTSHIHIDLLGSLGATGRGHCSDTAIQLGLTGLEPDKIDPDETSDILGGIEKQSQLNLLEKHLVGFIPREDIRFVPDEVHPFHPNAMLFCATNAQGVDLHSETFFSMGGGFVVSDHERENSQQINGDEPELPYHYSNAEELLGFCEANDLSISDLMLANEMARGRSETEIREKLLAIWNAMEACVERGLTVEGQLPGRLQLRRRAPSLYQMLKEESSVDQQDPLAGLDWINLYALAVGEENASGGRVVTAPTNGAAGIIPGVMHYCSHTLRNADDDRLIRFLLTAAAIGSLYKENASISGADVGCQGEIGVACSMAAAALAEYLGGTAIQVANAAEIGMEHHLGLTCDPIGGLVQIPCIERNAMGAVQAVNAARMALRRVNKQYVSLDAVIETMRSTGADMNSKYKETATGGLAVNVTEC